MAKSNSSLLNEGIQFFTAENINVNNNIKKGLTTISKCRNEAEELAKLKCSYVYDVFAQGINELRPTFFGYAVPK